MTSTEQSLQPVNQWRRRRV